MEPEKSPDTGTTRNLCISCQAPLAGLYCAQCGEKVITRSDYSLVHFFEHTLETFTHFDFKIFRTLKTLLFKPGQLTLDYLQGRRKDQVPPVQLFILINIAFVALSHLTKLVSFSTPMAWQKTIWPFSDYKVVTLAQRVADSGLLPYQFEREFDIAADLLAKTWIFVFIPVFAVLFSLLYGFRRYFFEMMIFSAHFWCFVLLCLWVENTFWYQLYEMVLRPLLHASFSRDQNDFIGSFLFLCCVGVYCYLALRKTFTASRWAASLQALMLSLVYFPIVFGYRLLLFFLTLWAM